MSCKQKKGAADRQITAPRRNTLSKSHKIEPNNYEGSHGSLTLDPLSYRDNRPESYEDLSPVQKVTLRRWIDENFTALKSIPKSGPVDSYTLKHYFEESDHGFYITNGQFKGAMFAAGHEPEDARVLNWIFRARVKGGYR